MTYHRCTGCCLVINPQKIVYIDGAPYDYRCATFEKAKTLYPNGYKLWLKIKKTVKYLSEINPKDLYENEDRLTKILESFGFDVDKQEQNE